MGLFGGDDVWKNLWSHLEAMATDKIGQQVVLLAVPHPHLNEEEVGGKSRGSGLDKPPHPWQYRILAGWREGVLLWRVSGGGKRSAGTSLV